MFDIVNGLAPNPPSTSPSLVDSLPRFSERGSTPSPSRPADLHAH
jgi:hypothetical protein